MSDLNLPAAARRLGVSVRILRKAIRLGNIQAPANINALTPLSHDWLTQTKATIAASPKALNVTPQKVAPFARFEGTSAYQPYPRKVRAYVAFKRANRAHG